MAYPGVTVHIADDPARALAEAFLAELRTLAPVHVAVSGGSTPRRLFHLLASDFREAVPWGRVTLWQVDERTVPPDDTQSNWRMLREEILDRIPEVTAYRIEAERPDGADAYERLLRLAAPREVTGGPCLDFVWLGMGADGHTASLFPDTAALTERRRLVVRNRVPQLGVDRVTLTFPVLEAARRRWFLVTGADKAQALRLALAGNVPAGVLTDTEWFIDPALAKAADVSP